MLIVHLFVSYTHVNLCHFFSSSWCRGLAAASACGSSWTFLFTFMQISNDVIVLKKSLSQAHKYHRGLNRHFFKPCPKVTKVSSIAIDQSRHVVYI